MLLGDNNYASSAAGEQQRELLRMSSPRHLEMWLLCKRASMP